MKRGRVFQLRLSKQEAERLEREAAERGVTKADLIRTALGWEKADRAPSTQPSFSPAQPEQQIDPERQPGLAAIHQLAQRLKGP